MDIWWTSFLVALGGSVIVTPLTIPLAKRTGMVDMPDGERKNHERPLPYLGGAAIYAASMISFLLVARSNIPYIKPVFMVGFTAIFVLGLIDDSKDVSPKLRLSMHFLVSLMMYVFGTLYYFTAGVFGDTVFMQILIGLFFVAWNVGIVSAVNWSDGMDGLAGGLSAIAALAFALILFLNNNTDFALPIATGLIGAVLGFLPYNWHPSKTIMGDNGSTFLGFMLGALSIVVVNRCRTILAFCVPILILAVPLMDMGLCMLRRKLRGQSMMAADGEHIHHKLIRRFEKHRKVVIIEYIMGILAAASGVLVYVFQAYWLGWIIVAVLMIGGSLYAIIRHVPASQPDERKEQVV